MDKIGNVFSKTTTSEFQVFLSREIDSEKLKFSFIEVRQTSSRGPCRLVAKVKDVIKHNPLLTEDQASFLSQSDILRFDLDSPLSKEFTYGNAICEILGEWDEQFKRLVPAQRGIEPNSEVYPLNKDILESLYSSNAMHYINVGVVESFDTEAEALVSLNGDSVATKHLCVFGMTGTGKTNTSAVLIEELMFRGYKIIIFDPHDDYCYVNELLEVKKEVEEEKDKFEIHKSIAFDRKNRKDVLKEDICPYESGWCENVAKLKGLLEKTTSFTITDEEKVNNNVCYRLLGYSSFLASKLPRALFENTEDGKKCKGEMIPIDELNDILKNKFCQPFAIKQSKYPQIELYGNIGLTLHLIEAYIGEEFTGPQRRELSRWLKDYPRWWHDQNGLSYKGNVLVKQIIDFLTRGRKKFGDIPDGEAPEEVHEMVRSALITKFTRLRGILERLEGDPLIDSFDVEKFVKQACLLSGSIQANIIVMSLSRLPDTVRRATVFAVIESIFNEYKYGTCNANPARGEITAHPLVFALEEARSLIPNTVDKGNPSNYLPKSATRQVAMEGRKLMLSLLIISQKPSSVDETTTSQANTFVLHQLVSPDDQNYVRKVTEGLSQEDLDMVKRLGEGRALISGDALKTRSTVLVNIRRRLSKEGLEKPEPVKEKVKAFRELKEQLGW